MWELNHKWDWVLKNRCFWIVVLEKTLESPLDSKEIKPVNLKGNQPWIFIGKTNTEAEAPILWPPDAEMTYWKRLWYWERLKAGGKGGNRGWDGWMAWSIQWTWVWANWEIVKDREAWHAVVHGVRIGHDWGTEQQQQYCNMVLCWPHKFSIKIKGQKYYK